MTVRMPLFPLGTVLYPGLLLPLHIFEERYRALVRDLTGGQTGEQPEDGAPAFGVIAIRQGREVGADGIRELHDVGCTAEIRRVEALPDGRFDLVTTGAQRFRLLKLDVDSAPYLVGEVEYLDEDSEDPEAEQAAAVLAASVAPQYLAYRDQLLSLQGQAPRVRGPLPIEPPVLSYLVAAAMVLDRQDKQDLLEAPDVAARLRAELALLRRERVMLTHLPSLPGADIAREAGSPN
ncbi:LON peptidase substrate-binding domain-containing protein [Sporichthya sp.]|uniref:LON peptidase substrate-binding domain-containing protein n=1 Tax=Sporichthya sp. TaxID=65475 RepID=UPI0018070EED|nr:LON peptidase substrate-binding domain-containing protein [Sporichthya sp.]MBA3743598.1 LON peptidase substrate-binding domain-containing protein [Sporichthya sp.]